MYHRVCLSALKPAFLTGGGIIISTQIRRVRGRVRARAVIHACVLIMVYDVTSLILSVYAIVFNEKLVNSLQSLKRAEVNKVLSIV